MRFNDLTFFIGGFCGFVFFAGAFFAAFFFDAFFFGAVFFGRVFERLSARFAAG